MRRTILDSVIINSKYVLFQIEALPEVVEAVKNYNVEIYLDGGVTTGTDVFKAIALGAKMVNYLLILNPKKKKKSILHIYLVDRRYSLGGPPCGAWLWVAKLEYRKC